MRFDKVLSLAAALLAQATLPQLAEAAPFTYQGRLSEGGQPATGEFDLRFVVYTDELGDLAVGMSYVDDWTVTDGLFAVELEFASLSVPDRWLEISVRPGSVPNSDRSDASYDVLTPRQYLTAAPYASLAFEASGLKLPIDETTSFVAQPALKITNGSHTAIAGHSSTGSGIYATSESGNGLFASSTTGWAGNFNGSVYVHQRLSLGYGSATSFKLACNGDAAKPGGGSWSILSDLRLKQNVQPLHGALDRLLSLRGCTYEYTPEAQATGLALPGRQVGFIAQEVEQVFPDWIGEDESGTKYITERGTTALFVEALRELRAERRETDAGALEQIGRQQMEIEALKTELSELRDRLDRAGR